ncbi:MAG: hypothetical protein JO307_05880 [Bryobacterales bacterium]|nr:hypothetical protein [Bryobacterales bacterium]MBV9401917.1 hypothetical protein [Bryobacterales bacterium]
MRSAFRMTIAAALAMTPTVFTACAVHAERASILLFNGTGASPADVAAIEAILHANHLNYSRVNSPSLNGMGEEQIRQYRLLIVPGGNFVDIGNSLSASTTTNIRNAVQSGLNYLGICAGAFFAGNSPYNGLNLTSGARFRFYSAEDRGIRKAAVPIASADGRTLDQYWEDGPQLTGWGDVVAKYPDGTPAVAEGRFGAGWVILSGVHPEAAENWRGGINFITPAEDDNAYAATIIQAARAGQPLPHY